MSSDQRRLTRRKFLQVSTGVAANICFWTGCSPVMTAKSQDDSFSFGVITDVQYADVEPSGTRIYRGSAAKLERCVTHLNTLDLAFVIHLGDLIDRDFASFDTVMPLLEQCRHPVHLVLGNHDFAVDDAKKAEVPKRMGLTQRYYDFVRGDWRFIVLDGNDQSLHAYAQSSDRYQQSTELLEKLKAQQLVNAKTSNGGVGETQLAWLKNRLTLATRARQQAIVFCHWPVYPAGGVNPWSDAKVIKVLESFHCAKAYMCGHKHAGAYAQKQGIHYLTFRAMLNGRDRTAYSMVRCSRDSIQITGYGDEPSRWLKLK